MRKTKLRGFVSMNENELLTIHGGGERWENYKSERKNFWQSVTTVLQEFASLPYTGPIVPVDITPNNPYTNPNSYMYSQYKCS